MKKMSIFILLISFCILLNSYAWAVSGGGETCATAIAVTPGDHSTNGPIGGLGVSTCADGNNSEWFKYIATADGILEVSNCGTGVDSVVYIHTTGCGSEDCDAGGDWDNCSSGDCEEFLSIYVQTGNTYLIEWTDYWENSGFNWMLAFTPGTGGGGDTCATALDVTPGTHIASGPKTGGGASSCSGATNSEWFSYTPSKIGMINISSCGAGVDNVLFIHSGGPCGTEDCADGGDKDLCSDVVNSQSQYTEQISGFSVTAGQTYYIEWTDQQENTGFFWDLTFNNVSTSPATNLLLLD